MEYDGYSPKKPKQASVRFEFYLFYFLFYLDWPLNFNFRQVLTLREVYLFSHEYCLNHTFYTERRINELSEICAGVPDFDQNGLTGRSSIILYDEFWQSVSFSYCFLSSGKSRALVVYQTCLFLILNDRWRKGYLSRRFWRTLTLYKWYKVVVKKFV